MATVEHEPTISDVLTLAEAAAYLRVDESMMESLVREEGLPGRQFKSEWRFLRQALNEWLRGPTYKQQLMALAGIGKDDPFTDQMLEDIYRERGRPMLPTDEDEEHR